MSIQDILQKIIGDAQKEASILVDQAHQQTEEIQKETLSLIEQKKSALEKTGQIKIDQIHKKIENLAKHQKKSNLLQAKREILLHVFEKAKEQILHLSDEKKEEILVAMINSIHATEGVLHPTKGEEQIVEAALKKTKKPFGIGETISGKGGFLFVTSTSEIDFRFDTIIDRELSGKMESEISPLLFAA